jgi:uncharacterized protein YjiK
MKLSLIRVGSGVAACAVLAVGCASSGNGTEADDSARVDAANGTLPIREVSGLAGRAGRYFAIGDRSSTVVTFRLGGDAGVTLTDVVKHNPAPAPGKKGSQYEAVTLDGKGNVVVLSELGEVIVLGADCDRETASTQLDWSSVNPLVHGHVDDNSLGEGMVILSSGHILVALEKSPTALIEFGPAGEAALGFPTSSAVLGAAFAPAEQLVALHAWEIDDSHLPDLSEISVGPDGALWGLSQEGGNIVRFERTLGPDEARASVKDHYALPSEIVGAEGLVFEGTRPVVARDRSAKSKNLFILDALW